MAVVKTVAYACLLSSAAVPDARADGWNFWGQVINYSDNSFPLGGQLATDGANLYYANSLQGVYAASLGDQWFEPLPMTGFPLWEANDSTNNFAISHIAVSPQGIVVISGWPVTLINNTLNGSPSAALTNTLPVFYWWDDGNQVWQPATVSGKTYPYTAKVGNFTVAADGSLWACSGFTPYAYRSTDGGKSYTAFNIDASVPANYLPVPFSGGENSFGNIFSIMAGWGNEVVVGTETGGFLHTTNNGQTWTSLDPNFTNTNSTSPLGRVNNAAIAGIDHHGYFLLDNFEMPQCPAKTNWANVPLIGYRPADGSYYNAYNGIPSPFIPGQAVTTVSSGLTYAFMDQNYLLQGGVYATLDGVNWSQFNQGSTLNNAFANNQTNLEIQGGCITVLNNLVFIGVGTSIYYFDSTPVTPITNRPPVALPQNLTVVQNVSTSFTLTGFDVDGDPLNFTITSQPVNGALSGTPPNLAYKSARRFKGLDSLAFEVDDGMATSAPVLVNIAVNSATDRPPIVSFTCSPNQNWFVVPANLVLSANVTAANGIQQVNFYDGAIQFVSLTSPPYVYTWTNPPIGDQALNVCAIDNAGATTWALPLNFSILPAVPTLSIQQADPTDIAITWPVSLDGFFVESATNANGPWTLSPYPQSYFTNCQTATIPMGDAQFFRLSHP